MTDTQHEAAIEAAAEDLCGGEHKRFGFRRPDRSPCPSCRLVAHAVIAAYDAARSGEREETPFDPERVRHVIEAVPASEIRAGDDIMCTDLIRRVHDVKPYAAVIPGTENNGLSFDFGDRWQRYENVQPVYRVRAARSGEAEGLIEKLESHRAFGLPCGELGPGLHDFIAVSDIRAALSQHPEPRQDQPVAQERETTCGCGHFLHGHGPLGCGECGCPLRPAEVVELLEETGRRAPAAPPQDQPGDRASGEEIANGAETLRSDASWRRSVEHPETGEREECDSCGHDVPLSDITFGLRGKSACRDCVPEPLQDGGEGDGDAFVVRAVPAHAVKQRDVIVTASALGSVRKTVFSIIDGGEEGICLNFTDADALRLPIRDALVLRVEHPRQDVEALRERDAIQVSEAHEARRLAGAEVERLAGRLGSAEDSLAYIAAHGDKASVVAAQRGLDRLAPSPDDRGGEA